MIRILLKALKTHPGVDGWLLTETSTLSRQAFYVLNRLETRRIQNTLEYQVTVYHRFTEDERTFLGSSQFAVGRKIPEKECHRLIEEAVHAASFIKNQDFELVEGGPKRRFRQKPTEEEPFDLLDRVAHCFVDAAEDHRRFNALELYYTTTTLRTLNSRGVDLTKTLNQLEIEAIPSYDGDHRKVELYRHFVYPSVRWNQICQDVATALDDVSARYAAAPLGKAQSLPVILRDENVKEFFQTLIEDYSYGSVYRQMTDKKIGDPIQKEPQGDLLTIGLRPSSPADAFDRDGVILKPAVIVEKGILKDYFGPNQYARYLGLKPNGIYSTTEVEPGTVAVKTLRKTPHIEIIALSGIQMDLYSGYLGGEVRLALWFDGQTTRPVSGFSFSGNIDRCLSNLRLSRETVTIDGYSGPRFVALPEMELL
jgi:predicted Zn-dependent protease